MAKISELHYKLLEILSSKTTNLEKILEDETIKYKDVSIGLAHNPTKRKKANKEAMELKDILQEENRLPTDKEKEILKRYTGNGGLGGVGSEDEFYTPDWVAKGAWDMFGDLPKGAKILDPSAGMGIFGQNAPQDVDLTQIELSPISSTLNNMITDLPMLHGTFQQQSYKIEDNSLDGIITNVPFAKVGDIGDDRFRTTKRLEQYFILRSLELLKYSKRAIFIVPTGIMDNTNNKEYKNKILNMASFVGGIRLPNKVFSHTGADVAVDMLVFEKHREDVYKAIKDNYVTFQSRLNTIFGDKQNHAFYYGTYFKDIGKKYVIGEFITSEEFGKSHFLGQTAHPKSTVVTTMSIEEIKEKVAILSKTKFKNIVKYDNVELLGDVSILDKLAIERMKDSDEFKAYINEFDNAINNKKNISLKELKEFGEKYNAFALTSDNAQLPSIIKLRNIYFPIMAINSTKWKINNQTLKMFNALCFASSAYETRDKKENKEYEKHNTELKKVIDKSYIKMFKESNDYKDQERINKNIAIELAYLRKKLISNWDFEKNEPIMSFEFKKFKTIEDVLQGKGLDLYKEFNQGGYRAKILNADEILEVDDVFLAQDGKIIPASWFIHNGASYNNAKEHIDSLRYSDAYGLSEDEFHKKIHNMNELIGVNKHSVTLDSLSLSHKTVSTLVSEKEMPIVRSIAQNIADGMNLAYIKSDNIIKTKNKKTIRMSFDDKGKEIALASIEEIEVIDFPSTLSISTFYAKNWEKNFNVLWTRHENEIKKALGLDNFSEIKRVYGDMQRKNKGEKGKDFIAPVEFFGKLKPIILKDILKYRDSFDIQLDTKLKLNPIISNEIKKKLDNQATIKLTDTQTHTAIESLRRYINDDIIDSNHGYQNEDIRHFSTALKGVICQDTGLGKTRSIFMSALLAVTTNRVNRALVVVPTSVYDKWVMEVRDGRKDKEGNLINKPILNEAGKSIVAYTKSSTSSVDWAKFATNEELRIMLMPHSVFETFSFKDSTMKKLFGTSKDEDRANKDNPEYKSIPSKLPDFSFRDWEYALKNVNNTIGYFEDGKVDFVVIDEGQMAKNSSTGGKSVKFASSITSSRYGVVLRTIQAIINHETFKGSGQGVVVATATPFTSSPLEIYTMLKNTGGLKDYNDFSEFEDTFMKVAEREEVMATDPNERRLVKVFEGLDNLSVLRSQGLSNIIYRNAKDESQREVNKGLEDGVLKPNKETFDVSLEESEEIVNARSELIAKNKLFKAFKKEVLDKGWFSEPSLGAKAIDTMERYKSDILSNYGLDVSDPIQRLAVSKKASTFSLIHGLNLLSINKDMALHDMLRFNVSSLDEDTLNTLIQKLLKANIEYKDVESFYDKDGELCEREITVKIKIKEFLEMRDISLLDGDILSIPAVDERIIKLVFDTTSSDGLLDIEDYPKYKTVLENITNELKVNPKAKQLIFSVSIMGARILEYFVKKLYKDLEIEPHKIMSALNIKASKAKKGEDSEQEVGALAQFQEDYNNSTSSTVLIFTTKNSTGVDFNKMTKAIHLVDIPYTPDVWHQAEGRGVRQGNKVSKVNVYKYSAKGTLDTMKKVLLSEKGSWQEELKDSSDRNSISSIQVDGKKIIEEVIANNPNATEEDIRTIIKEKQLEREAIIKEENTLKIEAMKASVLDSHKLISLKDRGNDKRLRKYLNDFIDFKGNKKSVNIFSINTNGKTVVSNIKKNGYSVVQSFVADIITDSMTNKDDIDKKLDELSLDLEYLKGNRASEYLINMASSTQYNKSEEYYSVYSKYSGTKVMSLSKEEVDEKRELKQSVIPKSMLTEKQYQEANMLLESYLDRAKNDIHTKILSINQSDEMFKNAVKNAIGIIDEDEKELYKGLLIGKSVITIDGDILNIDDTVKVFKQNYSEYIEFEPNMLLELNTYRINKIPLDEKYIFMGRKSKAPGPIAETIDQYHKEIEKLKGSIIKNKDRIEKYFNTSLSTPIFSEETLKPIHSLVEYVDMVKLVKTDLKGFDLFKTSINYIDDIEPFWGQIENEVITFRGRTIAIIDGNVFYTHIGISTSPDMSISNVPLIDEGYKSIENSNKIEEGMLDSYNYSLLYKMIDLEKNELKALISFNTYVFGELNGVLYPRYRLERAYKKFLEDKDRKEHEAKRIVSLSDKSSSDMTFDEVKDLMNGSDKDKIEELIDSILHKEFEDEDLIKLGEMIKLAKDGKIAKYGKYNDESKPIGIHISQDLNVVVTNGVPLNDFKVSRGRGAWAEVGIRYTKDTKTVYEFNGSQKEYTNTWEIEATQQNIENIKGV